MSARGKGIVNRLVNLLVYARAEFKAHILSTVCSLGEVKQCLLISWA